MTAHSNDKELIADHTPWVGEVQVPGSVSNLLEFRMAQHGHEVVGFTVHVPHYLAQTDYPAAAEALLAEVAKSGSLQIPLAELTQAAVEVHDKITNRSRRAAKSLKWWRRWSDSTMRSSPLRRTGRCWRAMRIYPAETSSVPSSRRFLAQQAGDKTKDDDNTIAALTGPTTKLATMTVTTKLAQMPLPTELAI